MHKMSQFANPEAVKDQWAISETVSQNPYLDFLRAITN